jgi:acyl-coenzyme A thioesterase PaaI-like protein
MDHQASSYLPSLLVADGGRARAQLHLRPGAAQPGAVPAIVMLGDAAALAAGASALGSTDDRARGERPYTLQLSLDLFRPDAGGTLTAEAVTTYRGHSTLVVDVEVRDAQRRLVAALVATQMVPRPEHERRAS